MIEFLSEGFRAASLVLLLAFIYAVIRYETKSNRKVILLAFLFTLIGYQLAYSQILQSYKLFNGITFFLAMQVPLAFWIMSKAFFDDDFKWNWKYCILVTLVPVLHYLLYRFNEWKVSGFSEEFRFLPYLLSVAFIILAIIEALKNREADLVLSRLRQRKLFVLFSSLLALASVYFFFTKDPIRLPPVYELIQNGLSCLFILWIFGAQLSYRNLFAEPATEKKKSSREKEKQIQQRIIHKLLEIFEKEGLYMQEGLTISRLAEHTGEKEYLLRRAINGELGYTNFNAFLNHYRIKEAIRLLGNDEQEELTFQEIAYRMGYQSVATFNRAFKNETGQTPTEYSRQNDE